MAGSCGISRGFPRLSPTRGQVPTRYSPVRHSCQAEARHAFDLHVLSMPPAFVLSQDQTLMFNPNNPAILADNRSVVTGPDPAQSPNPIRAIKRIAQDNAPARRQNPEPKRYLARATDSPCRRPRIPSYPNNV